MRRTMRLGAIGMAALVCAALGFAQEKGQWRAESKTAKAVTGDVAFAGDRIGINYLGFTVAQIRSLKPEELGAAFDADVSGSGIGNLYRLNIPGATKFLHKNTLCGSDDVQWMATFVNGKSLELAFFSGEKPPVLTMEGITNSTDLCGVYGYVR